MPLFIAAVSNSNQIYLLLHWIEISYFYLACLIDWYKFKVIRCDSNVGHLEIYSCQNPWCSYIYIYYTILYHIILNYIILYYIILYYIISYHIISYHIISYHIISYHIISYHIILYYIYIYYIGTDRYLGLAIKLSQNDLIIPAKPELRKTSGIINTLSVKLYLSLEVIIIALGAWWGIVSDTTVSMLISMSYIF